MGRDPKRKLAPKAEPVHGQSTWVHKSIIIGLIAIMIAREISRPAALTQFALPLQSAAPSSEPELIEHRGSRFYRVHPDQLGPNPLLDLHIFDSGLSPADCTGLIKAAEQLGVWGSKSKFGVHTKTEDADLQQIVRHSPQLSRTFEAFVQRLSIFITDKFIVKDPSLDGQAFILRGADGKGSAAGIDYDTAVNLRGMPFVIRYDAQQASALKMHKDNADISFILMLSDPDKDFEGGGTFIQALNSTVQLARGEALVFNGQLVHSAAKITSGRRYVLSGFTYFSDDFLTKKRKGTLKTMVYHH